MTLSRSGPHHSIVSCNSPSKMLQYSSASRLPSILVRKPGPSAIMQPHTMMEPPPCLRVPSTWLDFSADPDSFQHHFLPSEPKRLIFILSDKITRIQSATVQCWYFLAKARR